MPGLLSVDLARDILADDRKSPPPGVPFDRAADQVGEATQPMKAADLANANLAFSVFIECH
jgi:hypothetical protein